VDVYRNVFMRVIQSLNEPSTMSALSLQLDRGRLHHGVQILTVRQLVEAIDRFEYSLLALRLDSALAARSRCAEEVAVELVVEGVQRVELAYESPHARCVASQEFLEACVIRF
jgi:hypothetical protein